MDDGRKYSALLEDGVSSGLVMGEGLPAWPPDAVPDPAWSVDRVRAALAGAVGPELARVVEEVTDPEAGRMSDLPDDALGDLVVACGRLQSWAAGLQARVVGERAGRETSPLAHSSLVAQVTGELVVTGPEASEVVVRGESGVDHPTVISALTSGQIDVKKAHTLLRSAADLTLEERAEAIARYLPQAPFRTWRWLRSKLLAFAKSRHGASETARIAAQRRNVQLDRAENDMGWLSAYLPAIDAMAVWNVIDDMAHQLRRTAGEERDLGQLRADCLTGIVTGRLVPAGRFTQADEATGPGTGADGSNGSAAGAHDCDCGGRPPAQVVQVTPTQPVVRVTVPATALLGLDDAPGELEGFGPVTADQAGRIAGDATWQRLVTDPLTGVLTDCSTTSYRPGKVLREAVVARDQTCAFPHCEHPADRDDLDHIVPFDHDIDPAVLPIDTPGQTRADNLQPLCRRHHLLKTHGGWGVVWDAGSGITTWTAPSGRVHTRPPTVLDTHVELDAVEPDSSYDRTLRSAVGRRMPSPDGTAETGATPDGSAGPSSSASPVRPPF